MAPESSSFRTDLQALRGLAVLLVLLYHAELPGAPQAGYLGVDIFFVLSGYLITGIVVKELQNGSFTFTDFYFRRAKRLLPAAYVTFLATTLLSAGFLTTPALRDYVWQLFGAVTFTGNIALWKQTGYFSPAAELKPLLHVWSLSLEEQYYMLLPAALVFTPRRFWRQGVGVILLGSLALCLALATAKPAATFYLLPTRAWEFALGSLGVMALQGYQGVWLGRLFWPALAALLVVPFFPIAAPHPGWDALVVCTATLIVVLRRHPLLCRGRIVGGVARLGDMSYSLYLIHWPLLAFAANAWVSTPPLTVRLSLVCLALVLGYALFRWVERPIRQADISFNRYSLTVALGGSLTLVLIGFMVLQVESSSGRAKYVASIAGHSPPGWEARCEYGAQLDPRPLCQNSDTPRIMIWGDSYAMHLVEGIAGSTDQGVVQTTKTNCGPFVDISFYKLDGYYNRRWAEDCLSFNRSVLKHLGTASTVEVVVLSSFIGQYLSGNRLIAYAEADAKGTSASGRIVERQGGDTVALEALRATIEAIRALGKRVVVVSPPPVATFDVGRCLKLKGNGKAVFGADTPDCEISEGHFRAARAGVLAWLDRAEREADVPVIRLPDHLCRAGTCATQIDGYFLYRDNGHLSYDGSRLFGQEIRLSDRILELAR